MQLHHGCRARVQPLCTAAFVDCVDGTNKQCIGEMRHARTTKLGLSQRVESGVRVQRRGENIPRVRIVNRALACLGDRVDRLRDILGTRYPHDERVVLRLDTLPTQPQLPWRKRSLQRTSGRLSINRRSNTPKHGNWQSMTEPALNAPCGQRLHRRIPDVEAQCTETGPWGVTATVAECRLTLTARQRTPASSSSDAIRVSSGHPVLRSVPTGSSRPESTRGCVLSLCVIITWSLLGNRMGRLPA